MSLTKQEVRRDEKWIRAQPHVFSWCGDSYGLLQLSPHCFLKTSVFLHTSAEASLQPVRYKFYTNLGDLSGMTSNQGMARVSPQWIDLATRDRIAFDAADANDLVDVVTGKRNFELCGGSVVVLALARLKKCPGNTQAVDAVEAFIKQNWMRDPVPPEMSVALETYRALAKPDRQKLINRQWDELLTRKLEMEQRDKK